jgi:uncharacterized protein (DUF302 family)
MNILRVMLVAAFVCTNGPALADELVAKSSPYSVAVTVDRLVAAVEGAGAKVFARVDHAAGAKSVGSDLRPTQMLMFGNPKLGTPALLSAQSAGLDLPLRVVVYQDEAGQVHVVYHATSKLSDDHGIPADAAVLKKMAGALNNLTNKAIAK